MGFEQIWAVVDNPSTFFQQDSIKQDVRGGAAVHILIDSSNVSFADVSSAGIFANEIYVERFWKAIVSSGFEKVHIIKDGKHNPGRGVKKLNRMLDKLRTAITYEVGKNCFVEQQNGSTSISHAVTHRKLIQQAEQCNVSRASQEADSDIRILARKLVAAGKEVVIMSNDASLVLGVPSCVRLLSPTRCQLNEIPGLSDTFVIHGPCPSVQSIIDALNWYIFSRFQHCMYNTEHRLNPSSLCLVAALLGGEEDFISPANDPFNMVKLVSVFLFNHHSMAETDPMRPSKVRLLIAASLLVITASQQMWLGQEIRTTYDS
jgi:hypothetical protein